MKTKYILPRRKTKTKNRDNSSPADRHHKTLLMYSVDRRKIMPDGNMDPYKGIKSTENAKYVAKQNFFS